MDWRDLSRRQAGVIDRQQFAACGVTENQIRGMVARGELREVLPCVYAARPVPDSVAADEWAALLWTGGALSHRSAGPFWELGVPPPELVHVTVGDRRFRGNCRGTCPGVKVHRVQLPERDVVRVDGRLITTRPRTVIDLLRTEPFGRARDLRDRALRRDWLQPRDIVRSVSEQLGRTGNSQLRLLVQEVVAGAQAESERLLHRILRSAGVRGWVAQHPVRVGGRTRYIDVAFPELKIAIEVDGRAAHDDWSDRFDDDRARQNDLLAAGWRVLRFTWAHLQDPDYVLRQITQLIAA